MAKAAKQMSVEEQLRTLYGLQLIHSRVDEIHMMRGELPMEVSDLEDEIAGLETRIAKIDEGIQASNDYITERKNAAKDAEALIARYTQQLDNVKNNREFDALTKELDLQKLEIQLSEKRIREAGEEIEAKNVTKGEAQEKIAAKNKELDVKKKELDEVLKETEKEEKRLEKEAGKIQETLEERLVKAYHRIRSHSKNGQAVVPVERGAAGGSFVKIPPQRQLEIAARKKLYLDEHSGKILVDLELAVEEAERLQELIGYTDV